MKDSISARAAIVGAASNVKRYTVKLSVNSATQEVIFKEGSDEYNNSSEGPILYIRYRSKNNLLYIGECEKKYRVESGFYIEKKAKKRKMPAAPYYFLNDEAFKIHYVDVYQLDPSIYGKSKSNREKLEQYVRIGIEIYTGQKPKFNNDPNSKNFPRHIIDTGNQIICDMMRRGIINTKCITEER
ncbi:MAG: hypothetical protein M0Z70_02120 [Nitrospiraceae bacterium]|nr:hypothetical protein [Nitrospiraceae bacterium]